MTTIKEIAEIADNGYIDDPKMVASIMEEFVNMPMKEIFECVRGEVREVFDSVQDWYELEDLDVDEISYLELLTLIDHVQDEALTHYSEKGSGITAAEFKRFLIDFLKRTLMEAAESNLLVRLVLGLNTRAMLDYFGKRGNSLAVNKTIRQVRANGSQIHRSRKEMSDDESFRINIHGWKYMSLGDILRDTSKISKAYWSPWWKIESYRTMILGANDTDTNLLLSAFKAGYEDKMNIRELTDRYIMFTEDDDMWFDPENMDFEQNTKEQKGEI